MTHGQSDMASVLGQESSLLQLPRRQQSDKQYVNYLAQSMASFFFFFQQSKGFEAGSGSIFFSAFSSGSSGSWAGPKLHLTLCGSQWFSSVFVTKIINAVTQAAFIIIAQTEFVSVTCMFS